MRTLGPSSTALAQSSSSLLLMALVTGCFLGRIASRRRRSISWSCPCLPCPSEINYKTTQIPTVLFNVGPINGRAQALIGQTIRSNSSSSTESSNQGWKSEPRGVTLSNRRNLTRDKGANVHIHVSYQAVNQPLQFYFKLIKLSMIYLDISLWKDIPTENVIRVSVPSFQRMESPGVILSLRSEARLFLLDAICNEKNPSFY